MNTGTASVILRKFQRPKDLTKSDMDRRSKQDPSLRSG